jgi:hypothetical protein
VNEKTLVNSNSCSLFGTWSDYTKTAAPSIAFVTLVTKEQLKKCFEGKFKLPFPKKVLSPPV